MLYFSFFVNQICFLSYGFLIKTRSRLTVRITRVLFQCVRPFVKQPPKTWTANQRCPLSVMRNLHNWSEIFKKNIYPFRSISSVFRPLFLSLPPRTTPLTFCRGSSVRVSRVCVCPCLKSLCMSVSQESVYVRVSRVCVYPCLTLWPKKVLFYSFFCWHCLLIY